MIDKELHKILQRQLIKNNLSIDTCPQSVSDWQTFLKHVNRSYIDSDQDRYLTQRAMEVYSTEMSELYERLDLAQRISQSGYWVYDPKLFLLTLFNETINLLCLEPSQTKIHIDEFCQLILKEDIQLFKEAMENAVKQGTPIDIEIRVQSLNRSPLWINVRAQAKFNHANLYYISGILQDISARKNAALEVEELHSKLLKSARKAGMSDVAASLLHNIGNVLNSINVGLSEIKHKMDTPFIANYKKIVHLLEDHLADIDNFLNVSEQGKAVIPYINSSLAQIEKNNGEVKEEIEKLVHHFSHIKSVVASQNSLGGHTSLLQKLNVKTLVQEAVQLAHGEVSGEIHLEKQTINPDYYVYTDHVKFLQIVVNLIKNAAESLNETNHVDKKIIIYCEKNNDSISVIVQDNGGGISRENLDKIFVFGFSTKDTGHGYGLHSSIISTQELKGSLTAESDGLGFGAKFKLTLPIGIF